MVKLNKNSDYFYKNIFDAIPCYVSVQNKKLQIVASNQKFKLDFGDKTGSYCYEIYKHRGSPCLTCPVLLTFKDGESYSTEEVVTTKVGTHYNVITWTSPIRNKKNQIELVVEVSTDITKIRRFQSRLTSLGLMISSVSHGLRSMLTALDGGVYKLETGIKNNNTKRIFSSSTQIKQATNRIRKTILEILYYSRSRKFKFKKITIAEIISDFYSDFKKRAENDNIKFQVVNSSNYDCIEVDYNWFYIAFSNFIENSIDACISDAINTKHFVKIEIRNIENNKIEFLIQDNGIGISQEVKDKLFTLFFTSKGSQGTGLGLFIANQIISQHKGTVNVITGGQECTSIKINLPVKQL